MWNFLLPFYAQQTPQGHCSLGLNGHFYLKDFGRDFMWEMSEQVCSLWYCTSTTAPMNALIRFLMTVNMQHLWHFVMKLAIGLRIFIEVLSPMWCSVISFVNWVRTILEVVCPFSNSFLLSILGWHFCGVFIIPLMHFASLMTISLWPSWWLLMIYLAFNIRSFVEVVYYLLIRSSCT